MSDDLRSRVETYVITTLDQAGHDAAAVDAETPLISSGMIDSLALLQLAAFIEETSGRTLELDDIDFLEEWDTITGIVALLERLGDAPPATHP